MSSSSTAIRVFRLAEWPAPHSTDPFYLLARAARRALLDRPGRHWQNLPTIEVDREVSYLKARETVQRCESLFMAMPARLRAELQNDAGNFLRRLRDREFRDRLKADELMHFYGECSDGLIGKPYVKEATNGEDRP